MMGGGGWSWARRRPRSRSKPRTATVTSHDILARTYHTTACAWCYPQVHWSIALGAFLTVCVVTIVRGGMLYAGCPWVLDSGGHCAATADARAHVRCCRNTNAGLGACVSLCANPTMPAKRSELQTLGEARRRCVAQGMRLCTVHELQENTCCFTGCGADAGPVWADDNRSGACSTGVKLPPVNRLHNRCQGWFARSKLRRVCGHLDAKQQPRRCDHGGSSRAVPRRLLFNYRVNLLHSPVHRSTCAAANLNRTLAMHSEWERIFDTDTSCLVKLAALGVAPRVLSWYRMNKQRLYARGTYGVFMSDLCRLAQVFLHGGVYLDNDVYLYEKLDRWVLPYTFVSVGGLDPTTGLYQAMLAAGPGNVAVCAALRLAVDHLCTKSAFHSTGSGGYLGTSVTAQGVDAAYCTSVATNARPPLAERGALRAHGIHLLQQVRRGNDVVVTADLEGGGEVVLESRTRGKKNLWDCRAALRSSRVIY